MKSNFETFCHLLSLYGFFSIVVQIVVQQLIISASHFVHFCCLCCL